MMRKPKIRFKGYNEDWEQRKLGEIADKAVDNRGKTPFISKEGTHPLLEVASLGSGAPDYSKVTKYLSDETFKTELRAYIKEGDILFSTVGSIGLVSLMDTNENAAIAQNIVAFRANESYDSKFLYAMLSTEENQYKAQRIVMGAVQPSIKVSQLVDVEYFVTENIAEQRKLGEYFLNLDHLITLHQHKCDEMKKLKKYMLQKMFPQNGKKVPEIRFDGFTNDWEQRKLESLCDVFTDGDWIEAKDQSDSGIRLVQTGNVGTTEYLDKENNKKWISEETFERLHCEEIYEGDILISRLPEPAGRACIMPDLGVRMITAVDCTIVRTSKEYDSKYLVQYLSTPMYFKIVNSFLGGGTRQRISRGNLSGIDIPIPSTIEEQWEIGEFFSNLDHLITLHQHKCDELQNLKKYMLQNMFV